MELIEKIQAINILATDLIIVKTTTSLSMAEIDHIKEKLKLHFPENKVLILDSHYELEVYRKVNS